MRRSLDSKRSMSAFGQAKGLVLALQKPPGRRKLTMVGGCAIMAPGACTGNVVLPSTVAAFAILPLETTCYCWYSRSQWNWGKLASTGYCYHL